MIDHGSLRVRACVLGFAFSAALAAPASGATRVQGGRVVVDVTEAPWAVMIALNEGPKEWCSGSLISPSTVLTAAHCMDRAAAGFRVYAGWWPGTSERSFEVAFEQARAVSTFRRHPNYTGGNFSYDDVALVELAAPFDVSGPRVRTVPLADAPPAVETGLRFYGYGKPAEPEFRTFSVVLAPRRSLPLPAFGVLRNLCVGATAVLRCGNSPDGMACQGDSGGGVVTASSPVTLVAVASIADLPCQIGKANGFTEVAPPEIRSWIAGSPAPPVAPRRTGAFPSLQAERLPLGLVRCASSAWSGAPSLQFGFLDAATGEVLQPLGANPAYRPRPEDAGRTLACTVTATNAGGVAESAAANTLQVPTAWQLSVAGRRITSRAFDLTFRRRASLTFTDSAGKQRKRLTVRRSPPLRATIPNLPAGTYSVCLRVTPGSVFTAWNECVTATVDARAATLVGPVRSRRRGARFTARLVARAPAIGQQVTVAWSAAGCRRCGARPLGRSTVVLSARTPLVSPRVPRGRRVRLRITVPELPHDGARYTRSTATFELGRRP